MRSLQLVMLGCMLSCFRFSDARFLSTGEQTFGGVEKQKPAEKEAKPAAKPERRNSREAKQVKGSQQRRIWPDIEPLTWKFPEDPVEPKEKPPKFEPRQLEHRERVAARCGESKLQVEVSQDLLGVGRMIKPEDLLLGGCPATEVDNSAHVIVFESELHACGSKSVMTENALIYAFTLVYKPRVKSKAGILRNQSFIIGVECHYPR